MIKNSVIAIVEICLYVFIMNKLDLLTEFTMVLGVVIVLSVMAITKLDDIQLKLNEIFISLGAAIIGSGLDEKAKAKMKEELEKRRIDN